MGVAFMHVMISSGTAVGSLVTGLLQEALGDLRLSLLIVGFAPLSLTIAATLLRPGTVGQMPRRLEVPS